MNEKILKQWAAQAVAASPYYNKMFPPSPYYRFLKVLAQNIQPKLSIELGVDGGGGSLHLAMGWFKGIVIGIDNEFTHQKRIEYIKTTYDNFEFWLGDSIKSASILVDLYGKVDILFIDTTHTYEQTMAEYNAWLPHMANEYVICFDDLLRPGMSQVWKELSKPKLRMDFLHDGAENGGGFGMIWNEQN